MTVGERVKKARLKSGLSVDELAVKIGKDRSTIYRYESNEIEKLPTSIIEPLSKALGVLPSFLMGWEEIDNSLTSPTVTDDVITFPVVGDIAAGFDQLAVEDWSGETVDVPLSYLRGRNKSEFFVLNIKGDSMYPLYHEGDKVLILKQSTLNRSGDIGAVIYEGECATLKKVEYVVGEDWMRLIPLNPNYKPVEITGVDLERCRVLGIPFVLIREFYL